MSNEVLLRIDGEVLAPRRLTFADLAAVDRQHQVADVGVLDPKRRGVAVSLEGLLQLVQPNEAAHYLGLHSSADDFHASIPLQPIRDRAVLIYELDGKPLDAGSGGPLRFLIPDYAACHTEEIDECANVKFVDHLELTSAKGFDNRPQDDQEHEALHGGEH